MIISEIAQYMEMARKKRVGLIMKNKKAGPGGRRTAPVVGGSASEQTMVIGERDVRGGAAYNGGGAVRACGLRC